LDRSRLSAKCGGRQNFGSAYILVTPTRNTEAFEASVRSRGSRKTEQTERVVGVREKRRMVHGGHAGRMMGSHWLQAKGVERRKSKGRLTFGKEIGF